MKAKDTPKGFGGRGMAANLPRLADLKKKRSSQRGNHVH